MLWNASGITGYTIAATDGRLGTVRDFLFDDSNWSIRWLVVETGHWLSGRKVLIPVIALGDLDPEACQIAVKLTMQQVKDSPDIDAHRPVSRQMESNFLDYYGWSPYLGVGTPYAGNAIAAGPVVPPPMLGTERRGFHRHHEDPHLRSLGAVRSYHIHACDGEIGHLKDALLEDFDWSIRYLVVDTQNWWPGKSVLVAPKSAENIDWATSTIELKVNRQKVKGSPAYDPSKTVDGAYERHFHRYYDDSLGTD